MFYAATNAGLFFNVDPKVLLPKGTHIWTRHRRHYFNILFSALLQQLCRAVGRWWGLSRLPRTFAAADLANEGAYQEGEWVEARVLN